MQSLDASLEKLAETALRIKAQRDELLAALEVAQYVIAATTQDSLYDSAKAKIRAAIAMARGEG